METLPLKVTNAIAGPVLQPAYLVQIDFSYPIRASTRGELEYEGSFWPAASVMVGEISSGQGGGKSVQISVANNAFAFSQIVLAESASGKRVRVWKLFGEAPYSSLDATLVFDGFIDSVPEMIKRVVFNCTTGPVRSISIPNVTIGPPYFNHLPRSGQVINWGGEKYELQPR
jgi:hypothetical protein